MNDVDRDHPPAPAAIRPLVLPTPARTRLENGVTVLAGHRPALPVVTAHVVLDAGGLRVPAAAAGLASLCANALDAGTSRRSGADLAWAFEEQGVELETWAGWDALSVRATTHRDRLEPTLELIAEVVRHASFPDQEVARLREEQLAELLQRRKEPRALANDMAAHFIFGPGSTYGRSLLGSPDTLTNDDRDAVVAFQKSRFVPASSAVIVTGAVEPDEVVRLVGAQFADWDGEPAVAPAFVSGATSHGRRTHIVDRPDAVQSEIRVGHPGVARGHPDYFPLTVMNAVLGGAFTSRLNLNLRERNGYTYGVRSSFAFRREAGPFVIQTAVATEVTAPAVAEILSELEGLREGGASDAECAAARDYLAGTLPLELQTTAQISGRFAELAIFDLPDNYFDRYAERIQAVTCDDVLRVAREHLHVDDLTFVIVGNRGAIEEPLASLDVGPIETHEGAS